MSPALLQSYVAAAARLSRLAVGDPNASSGITTYRAPRGLQQAGHLDGQPLGTRGGMSVRHVFPLDAEYEIRVGRGGNGFGLEALGGDEETEVTVNGERVAVLGRGGPRAATIRVPAGPQVLGAAIVRKRDAQGVDDLFAEHAPTPGVTNVSIVGPLRTERRWRHAEPAPHLRLLAGGHGRGTRVCGGDPRAPRRARVSPTRRA